MNKDKSYANHICLQDLPIEKISIGMKVVSMITHRTGEIVEITEEFFDSRIKSPWIRVKWEKKTGMNDTSFFPHYDEDYASDQQPWRFVYLPKDELYKDWT